MSARDERPLAAVPRGVFAAFAAALIVQISLQLAQPKAVAHAEAMEPPPAVALLRIAGLGEPLALAQLTTLYLQAFDNQPGISIPFLSLDYAHLELWLKSILDLDAIGQYPLLLAAQVYSQVPDQARQRRMARFVHAQFLLDPNRRWRWLAHVTIMAKHRLHDDALALSYAADITRLAPAAPSWARQMQIFILEDMGEVESAKILIGGLLDSSEIKDKYELRFLIDRLESLEKKAEKSSPPSKYPPNRSSAQKKSP